MGTTKTGLKTLAIDIGGTGLKALVIDDAGKALTDRQRIETPHPSTPKAILAGLMTIIAKLGKFDRISCGFPGVVVDGVVQTAPNLGTEQWRKFDLKGALQKSLGKPAMVLNDAGVQGHGVVEGKGVEMVLTLGTGMGCALFLDGKYVPNLELAHHPFKGKKTYEDYVGNAAYLEVGKKKWNKRVAKVIAQIEPIWNPRRIYLGGGNAKHLKIALPKNVTITENIAGLLGGAKLWA
ncbi:MAG TPA: ROK family protein [Polyangiaceae bacterium]